jgi:hypothetical protein
MSSEIAGAEIEKLAALTEDELVVLLGEAFHGSFPGDRSRRGWKFFARSPRVRGRRSAPTQWCAGT